MAAALLAWFAGATAGCGPTAQRGTEDALAGDADGDVQDGEANDADLSNEPLDDAGADVAPDAARHDIDANDDDSLPADTETDTPGPDARDDEDTADAVADAPDDAEPVDALDARTDDEGGDAGTEDTGGGVDDADGDGDGDDGEGEDDVDAPPGGHDVCLEAVRIAAFEGLTIAPNPLDAAGYGHGGALVDFDGDGRLDLLLGGYAGGAHPGCLYRNVSTPGNLAFEPWEDLCGTLGGVVMGLPLPDDGEGRGTPLLVLGEDEASVLRWQGEEEPARRTLVYRVGPGTERPDERCTPGAAVVVDVTFEGVAEVLVGCAASTASSNLPEGQLFARNRVLGRDAAGAWSTWWVASDDPIHDEGSTLAIGVVDLDDNGLPDLVLANDSFSTVNRRRTELPRGIALVRRAPGEGEAIETVPFLTGPEAWGSYMGVSELRVGDERMWYVTDWGPNRLFRWNGETFEDRADDHGIALASSNRFLLFAWSAVVDDFNGDGLDDLLVTQGTPTYDPVEEAAHRDALLLQRRDGGFDVLEEGYCHETRSSEGVSQPGQLRSSRAAIRADLDLDGRVEIVLFDLRAPPRVLREQVPAERPLRCNVDPVPLRAASVGAGYAFALGDDPTWRTWDVQGHMHLGAPSRLLLPGPRGRLRFPSGAIVPFDCGEGAGPVTVDEPDWIELTPETEDRARLRLDASWVDGPFPDVRLVWLGARVDGTLNRTLLSTATLRDAGSALRAGLAVERPAGARRLMVRIGDRWIPWTLSAALP